MNTANYKHIAEEMNKEYARVKDLLIKKNENIIIDINTIDFDKSINQDNAPKNVQEEIIQVALDLTSTPLNNYADYTISQIGSLQFWRDSDSILIIDSDSNKFVAYGKDNDFFPELIPIDEIDLQSNESLVNKACKVNSNLVMEYNPQILNNAHDYIKRINISPKLSYKNPESNSLFVNTYSTARDYLKNISSKLNINSLVNLRKTIKLKADIIKTRIISQRLLVQARNRFDSGYKRTEEQEYYVDQYIIRKTENNVFELYDSDNKLLLVGFPGKENVVLQNNLGSYDELNKALKSLSNTNISMKGNELVEKQYQVSVFSLIRKLANYENGNYKFKLADDNIYIRKNKDVLEINNNQGSTLLSATKKGNQVDLSQSEIFKLDKVIEQDITNKEQNLIIPDIALIVKSYLDINQVEKIEKNNFTLIYNSESKTIEYQDKLDPNNYFQAQQTLKGWQRLKGQIKVEKQEYFSQLKTRLASLQSSRIHDKSQKL
jgi:hypothetical protein